MGKVMVPKGFEPKLVKHWYLVANRVEALVYEGKLGKDFRFRKRLRNPKGKLTELQLVSDRPGRAFSSAQGSRIRHGYEARSQYHEEVAIQFSRRVARVLERAILRNEFSDLVVMAEPHFLGLLNRAFSRKTKASIRRAVPREWNEGSDRELEGYLKEKLA